MLTRAGIRWDDLFDDAGAVFKHDGNLDRPFPCCTSGNIADSYFNSEKVVSDGRLFGNACDELYNRVNNRFDDWSGVRIVGAAMGAVALRSRLAEAGSCRSAYAIKAPKAPETLIFESSALEPAERIVLAEDTILLGTTIRRLIRATKLASPGCTVAKFILVLCNRTGVQEIDGFEIVSLMDFPAKKLWKPGHNPYTINTIHKGAEAVPPIQSVKQNWAKLTGIYPKTA